MSSESDDRQAPQADQGLAPAQPEQRDALRPTDPKAMRALAHPVRMALLELFAVNETLTATQASEALGESPANCAFHLRTLAKYGYIEEAGGGRGRERPWTRPHRIIAISSRDQEPQAAIAAKSLSRLWRDLVLDRIRRVFAAGDWPDGWEHTPQSSTHVVYLTPEETAQVARAIHEVLDRYNDRRAGADPALRPAGALPVEFSFFGYPRADLAAVESKETGK
jgi:predicted transcriptional regulator